jgi:Tfp pilus assembly protein PilX
MSLPANKVRGFQESLGCVLTFVVVMAIVITLLARWLS